MCCYNANTYIVNVVTVHVHCNWELICDCLNENQGLGNPAQSSFHLKCCLFYMTTNSPVAKHGDCKSLYQADSIWRIAI